MEIVKVLSKPGKDNFIFPSNTITQIPSLTITDVLKQTHQCIDSPTRSRTLTTLLWGSVLIVLQKVELMTPPLLSSVLIILQIVGLITCCYGLVINSPTKSRAN